MPSWPARGQDSHARAAAFEAAVQVGRAALEHGAGQRNRALERGSEHAPRIFDLGTATLGPRDRPRQTQRARGPRRWPRASPCDGAAAHAPRCTAGVRLRVGYLTADVHDHPTALLIRGMFAKQAWPALRPRGLVRPATRPCPLSVST